MASLEFDTTSGRYRIRFRYGGRPFKRSLKTHERAEAEGVVARVEETIRLLDRGRIDLPPDADPGVFILSDGKLNGKITVKREYTLENLLDLYLESLPKGAKAQTTLNTEEIHRAHLLRHLKKKPARSLTTADMQKYVEKRLRDDYRDRRIRPDTVKKEVATFRLVWNWAVAHGYLTGPAPTKNLKYPKTEQKPPFMTWKEIETIIARGGLKEDRQETLWDCLFLTGTEVEKLLEDIKETAGRPFIFPMFVFVAHTGARRSEILRSQISDFDFGTKTVLIREKKKSHGKSLTYRRVPMTALLLEVMEDWFARRPGGQFAICDAVQSAEQMAPFKAHNHFKRTLKGSKWEKIRGFHVFRHSFASNLAAAGVDQRIIDEWMGHQTDEMRRRYRHLFPDQQREAIESVFGRNGK